MVQVKKNVGKEEEELMETNEALIDVVEFEPQDSSIITEDKPAQWTVEEVFKWAKIIADEEEANKLRSQKVNGVTLLKLTRDELINGYKILRGSASNLAEAIEKLKAPVDLRRDLISGSAEPNLGLIRWGPIVEQFKKDVGLLSPEQSKELEDLPAKIKDACKLGPLDILDETHVNKYFQINPSHPFKNTVMEIIVALTKSNTKLQVPKQNPLKFLEAVVQNLTSESRENMHTVSTFGLVLPLVEREHLGKIIWENIKTRYELYLVNDSNREKHKRLFCYGPPGTGKSRTAVECINLAIGYATHPDRQSQLTGDDKKLIENLRNSARIFICFGNGTPFCSTDRQFTHEEMLALRAFHSYFNLTTSNWNDFAHEFLRNVDRDTIKITLLDVMKLIREDMKKRLKVKGKELKDDQPLFVFINIDEFNVLVGNDTVQTRNKIVELSRKEIEENKSFIRLKEIEKKLKQIEGGETNALVGQSLSEPKEINDLIRENELRAEFEKDPIFRQFKEIEDEEVDQKKNSFFHGVMDILGAQMCRGYQYDPKIFYIPFPTGTAYTSMYDLGISSGHPVEPLQHKFLSPTKETGRPKLYNKLAKKEGFSWLERWNDDNHFKFLDHIIGGWPRPLEFFLEKLKIESDKGIPLKDMDMREVGETVRQRVEDRYAAFVGTPVPVMEQILVTSIAGISVCRMDRILESERLTWSEAEEQGLLLIKHPCNTITTSFLWVHLFRNKLWKKITITPHLWDLLVDPTWQFHWQHWEDFVLQFMETKILCSLKVMQSFEHTCQLKQLCSGLNGSNNLLDISVFKPTNIKSVAAGEQFPHKLNIHSFDTRYACEESYPLEWWKTSLIVKNYTNAKGIDIFLLLRCRDVSVRYLLLCMQLKWKEFGTKNVEKFTHDDLKNMHEVNSGLIEDAITTLKQMKHRDTKDEEQLEVLNHSKVVTVLVTNKKFEGDIPDNCGIISKEQFGQFFGPFGEIGAFYNDYTLKPRIEINLADKDELQRIDGIGPKIATSVIAHRNANGPFKSVEELIKAIPRLKHYEYTLYAQCLFTTKEDRKREHSVGNSTSKKQQLELGEASIVKLEPQQTTGKDQQTIASKQTIQSRVSITRSAAKKKKPDKSKKSDESNQRKKQKKS